MELGDAAWFLQTISASRFVEILMYHHVASVGVATWVQLQKLAEVNILLPKLVQSGLGTHSTPAFMDD